MISGRSQAGGTWRKVLALAPVLMLVVSLPGQILTRCRMDGRVRMSCCCPADRDAKPPAGPAWREQACCDRQVANRALPIAELTRTSPADQLPVAFLVSSALVGPARVGDEPPRAFQAHGPPGQGPRIVILKHALLI